MSTILWAFADTETEWNTSFHRVIYPSRILEEQRGHTCHRLHISHLTNPNLSQEVKDAIDASQVIVLERLLLRELQPLIQKWKGQGKFIAATFDDNYALMPPSGMEAFNTWRGGRRARVGKNKDGSDKVGAILGEFRETLKMVDTALVPSKVLMEDYKPYCPNIKFVPNVPYKPIWDNLKKRPIDNQVIIGWGGSTAHAESWSGSNLAQALGIVCKRYPRVHIALQTRDPRILIMLDKANLQGRYTSSLWVPFEIWPQVVNRWDISVAPLCGEYDRRRSALKHFEAGMAHIPFIGTNLEPYQDGGGGSILVENRASDWADAISSLIDIKDKYERLAREGREWAEGLYANAADMYEKALNI